MCAACVFFLRVAALKSVCDCAACLANAFSVDTLDGQSDKRWWMTCTTRANDWFRQLKKIAAIALNGMRGDDGLRFSLLSRQTHSIQCNTCPATNAYRLWFKVSILARNAHAMNVRSIELKFMISQVAHRFRNAQRTKTRTKQKIISRFIGSKSCKRLLIISFCGQTAFRAREKHLRTALQSQTSLTQCAACTRKQKPKKERKKKQKHFRPIGRRTAARCMQHASV